MDFGRIITAMVTPFDSELKLDLQRTEDLVEHLITEQKTDGIVVVGTTGESPTLTKDEKLTLIQKVVETANGRAKVIAGTGSNDTASSVAMTRQVAELGVDGILLVNPYYNRPTQEGLYQHFRTIAESTSLPVMLYNIPGRTGVNMTAETTIRLSQVDNIVAMKEASGNLTQMAQIISGTSEDFLLYSGDDALMLPVLAIGGHGVVSVASHVIGKEMQELLHAFLSGDVKEASRLHLKLLPLMEALFTAPNPVPLKALMAMRGFDVGSVRLPLVEATNEQKNLLKQWI